MASNILQTTELIQRANEILAKHSGYLDQAATSLNKYVNSAKLPSDYVNSLKSVDDLNKKITKSTRDVEREQKKLQRERLSELRLQKKRERAFDKYERQLQREERQLKRTSGLYNRIQRGVTEVSRRYNDLAAKKALNGRLTEEEALELDRLSSKLNKYQGVLKKVDANIGKYQRNVGNYASGWNGLGNSINQLTREAPAFANSVQTGFMALSNNIPILTDEIGRLVAANKALQAEGKPTVSVFRQIMKSLFSFQTLMSVGITLLVLYGKEIGDWASSVMGAGTAADRMAENTKKINEESAKLSGQTIPQFKALVQIATDVTESEERRANAIKELNDQYPDFNANILKEGNNTDTVNVAIAEYINKLGQKAKAQASMNLMQEKYSALIIKEEETKQRLNDMLTKTGLKADFDKTQSIKDLSERQSEQNKIIEKATAELERQAMIKIKAASRDKRLNNMTSQASNLIDDYNKSKKEESIILEEINSLMGTYIDNVDLSTNAVKNQTQASQDYNDVADDTFGFLTGTIPYYEEILKGLKEQQTQLSRTSKDWYAYQQQIDAVEGSLETLRRMLKGTYSDLEGTEAGETLIDNLVKSYSPTSNKSKEIKENWETTFQSISDVASRTFGIINQLSERSFQKQFADLEKQKEAALQFAGESATARAEIERQFEEKRKQIQQKQARAQKLQSIFQVLIDTPPAIVRALKTGGPALAAVVGGLAAAQLALVASQPIPQFWQGGEVGGQQQIMVNDDPYGVKGRNYKEVIEKPNGQILTPTGKNVKMTVPKGTIVHPTYNAFMQSLDSELLNNNIMPIGQPNIMPMVINQGLSKSDILDVMSNHASRLEKTISNQKGFSVNIDENGINKYIYKKSNTSKIMNARYKGRGRSV